jgi:FAD/FMN-containing dehydrogenase
MAGYRLMKLSGWGNYRAAECKVWRLERHVELHQIVSEVSPLGVIARGLGRSYGDSAINEGGNVALTERLNRFVSFDPATSLLTCEAGVSLDEIIRFFLPRGFFPPVTPGTKYVTLGGAVAADVHGKNHHVVGSIGNFIERFELVTGQGTIITCSRSENPDAFWATIGGMGLTGIISVVTLRLQRVESAYIRANITRVANLDEALARMLAEDESVRYSVSWVDCMATGKSLGRSVLIQGNLAARAELPARYANQPLRLGRARQVSIPFAFPPFALNQWSIQACNTVYYAMHKTNSGQLVHYDRFFYPLDSVARWNRIYGKRGFVQYQALLPPESARHGMRLLLKAISDSQLGSFLAVLKKTGAANDGLLSFCKPGFTLALDMPNHGQRLLKLLARLDNIVLDHGGRLYLAKDAVTSPEAFCRMYPRLDEFRAVCHRLDPEHRFCSSQARRLKIL